MILIKPQSRAVLQILLDHLRILDRPRTIDFHLIEFGDVRYHVQASVKEPEYVVLSILLPPSPPETVLYDGLPLGAIEAVRGAFGTVAQIVDPVEDGYDLTIRIDLRLLPEDDGDCLQFLAKIASIRAVILGAPMREILKHLANNVVSPDADCLVPLMHRPKESCFLIPQPEKVTVVFPMRFKDNNDITLATAFLQEFMETRRMIGLNSAPPCVWSQTPPLELKGVPVKALDANCGFVSFVVFPRHVEGDKLDRTVWNLCSFHAYVSYHIKCSKAFMHTRMRRRVETLIQILNRAKPDTEKEKKTVQGRSFRRLVS